jgi:hypothetical protein
MFIPTIPSLVKCVYYPTLMQPFFALLFAITSCMPSIVETYMLLVMFFKSLPKDPKLGLNGLGFVFLEVVLLEGCAFWQKNVRYSC